MTYKQEIYSRYISNHNAHLYGSITVESIRNNYSLWDLYYYPFLPEEKDARILDIGCGDGSFIHYLKEKGFSISQGIDISEEQINLGKSLGVKNIQIADIFHFLKTHEENFDFIIARDVLEHFSKKEVFEILVLARQALSKGGSIMVQVPNGEGVWYEKIYYGDFTHETIFSKDSARQVFLSAGYAEVDSYPIEFPARSLKSITRKIFWKIMIWQHKFRKWIATGDHKGIFTPNLLVIAMK